MDTQKKAAFSYKTELTPKTLSCFKKGYSLSLFKQDLIAGVTVGVVALPLAMAFAIASGLAPVYGIYTGIVAGFLISFLGGSYTLIGGPTGAFVVIIYGIVQKAGYEGLVMATLLAGLVLILSGLTKVGSLIKHIPHPLIIGFTTGIAVLIFTSQIKDFLGLQISTLPPSFIGKCSVLFSNLSSLNLSTFSVASATLFLILILRNFFPKVPWGITAIGVVTLFAYFTSIPVSTIATEFGYIPKTFPSLTLPNFSNFMKNWPLFLSDAFTIAFLAGIESLLAAVVADGMTGRKHRPNCELVGQGFANIASVLFGGIPATGAIARTATSIKSGAKTPVAGMIHAATLLVILLLFSKTASQIPLACLSAVLMVVAWNMSEIEHFIKLLKSSFYEKSLLLITFILTVFVDLIAGVFGGIAFASLYFVFQKFKQTKKS